MSISDFTVVVCGLCASLESTVWMKARIEGQKHITKVEMARVLGITDTYVTQAKMTPTDVRNLQVCAPSSQSCSTPHYLLWRCTSDFQEDHKHAMFLHREPLRVCDEMAAGVTIKKMMSGVYFTSVCLPRAAQAVECELEGKKPSKFAVPGSGDVITAIHRNGYTVTGDIGVHYKTKPTPFQRPASSCVVEMPAVPLAESAPAAANPSDSCVVEMPSFPEEAPHAPRLGWLATPKLRGAISACVSASSFLWTQLSSTVTATLSTRPHSSRLGKLWV
jgi:hypothetical protein